MSAVPQDKPPTPRCETCGRQIWATGQSPIGRCVTNYDIVGCLRLGLSRSRARALALREQVAHLESELAKALGGSR